MEYYNQNTKIILNALRINNTQKIRNPFSNNLLTISIKITKNHSLF